MNYSYALLARGLLPEISLIVGALLVLAYDLIRGRQHTLTERRTAALCIGATALIAAIFDSGAVGALGPI